jgi:hypothetical protein
VKRYGIVKGFGWIVMIFIISEIMGFMIIKEMRTELSNRPTPPSFLHMAVGEIKSPPPAARALGPGLSLKPQSWFDSRNLLRFFPLLLFCY